MRQQNTKLFVESPAEHALDRLSLVQADKTSLQQWLASLSMLNLGDTAKQLYTTLKELAVLKTTEHEHFELIEVIRPYIHTIISSLTKHYMSQNLSLDQRAEKIARLVEEIRIYLINIYQKIAIECFNRLQSQNFGLFNLKNKKSLLQLTGIAVHRSLSEISGLLYELQILYLNIPHGLWEKTHELYSLSDKFHILNVEIEDKAINLKPFTTIEAAYKRLVIQGASNTNKLRQAEIKAIYQLSILWAPLVKIDKTETPFHLFSIDLITDQPPIYITKNSGHASSTLFVNVQQLLQHFKNLISKDPKYINQIEHKMLSTALKVHLLNTFSIPSERSHTRHPYSGKIQVAFGLLGIHDRLSNGKIFEDIINVHRDSLASSDTEIRGLFGQIEYESDIEYIHQKSETANERSTVYECDILNISPNGYCLRWQGDTPVTLRAGELLVVCEPNDKVWHIGLIRWVKQLPPLSIEFGIEIISSRAKVCGIRASLKNNSIESFKRAVLLPEVQTLNRPATIITQAFAFHPDQSVIIRSGNDEIRAKLMGEYLITQSFIQYEYSIDEERMSSIKGKTAEKVAPAAPLFDDEVWKIL